MFLIILLNYEKHNKTQDNMSHFQRTTSNIYILLFSRTLNELVLHYAVNSLEEHNEQLRTALKYPVNAHLVKKPEKKQHDSHQLEVQPCKHR